MKREDHVEIWRLCGVVMMFFVTVLAVLILYTSYEHGMATVQMTEGERELEAFIFLPAVLFISLFTMSVEFYRLAEKLGLRTMIGAVVITMFAIVLMMFWRLMVF